MTLYVPLKALVRGKLAEYSISLFTVERLRKIL